MWAGGEAALRAAGRGGGRRRPGQVPGGGVAPERLGEGGDAPAVGGWWADGAAVRAAGRGRRTKRRGRRTRGRVEKMNRIKALRTTFAGRSIFVARY